MKSIKNINNLKGKKVLLRVDYNVPIKNNKVLSDFRIKASVKTIQYLQKKGAIVILLTHLGSDGELSLNSVSKVLGKYIKNFNFIENRIFSDETRMIINDLKNGDVVLLENIRQEIGETKNSPSFARGISRYGDIYVNDAFSVSHRVHASIVGISKHLPSYAGFQMLDEIENLSKSFDPKHPFLFILGGSKFETKIPLIKKYIRIADKVYIGGAIANDFFRAKGYQIGTSLSSESNIQVKSLFKNDNLILPKDVVVKKDKKSYIKSSDEVDVLECIVDIGDSSINMLKDLINKSKFILWNGPLGKYEDGFDGATEKILKIISNSNAISIIGGGDTVYVSSKLKLNDKFNFVSTGGGATLEFLLKGTLPGIKALEK